MPQTPYQVSAPSRARATLREQLIEAGLLRPRRYDDGMCVFQLPAGTVVFRLDERTRLLAERGALS